MTDDLNTTDGIDTEEATDRVLPENATIAALVEPFESAVVVERSYASSEITYFAISIPVGEWVAFAEAAKRTALMPSATCSRLTTSLGRRGSRLCSI